jgi:hypothetical protein
VEVEVNPQPKSGIEVVLHVVMVEDATLLHSVPMPKTGTSSCGGLKLLDDKLLDLSIVSLNMESWHRTEHRLRYVASTLSSLALLSTEP